MSTYNTAEEEIISTDAEEEETTPPIDQIETHYPDDEEFDPYDSGLNDFTFEDASEEADAL